MSVLLAAVALVTQTIGIPAATARPHYAIRLTLDPARSRWRASLAATGLTCAGGTTRVHLNRAITIDTVSVDGHRVRPRLDPLDAPQFWITADRALDLPCPKRSLRLDYAGPGLLHPDGRNQVSPKLVELSLYGGWYPLVTIGDRLEWTLTTKLPTGWRYATPARVQSAPGGELRLTSRGPSDLVLIASPGFAEETIRSGEVSIRLLRPDSATEAERARARAIARAAADMASWGTRVLGPARPGGALRPEIAFTPRGGSLSYSRLPLIILRAQDLAREGDRPSLLNVRHEVAHFWSRAPQRADWLNEGVAEYLAILRTGDRDGAISAEAVVADYQWQVAAKGVDDPVGGEGEHGFLNGYARPALLFDAIARRHGRPAVEALIRDMVGLGDRQDGDALVRRATLRLGVDEGAIVAACLAARDWPAICGG